ncbi:MAG: protein-L-isoaspartate(D-aspartate) O-methyltransferase [Isosphaeraceae bacterium]|nr:protein-L-isoaspartate(D-aspartate) O-methyltransferase [Isosphaeraceae bacterium]
MSALIARPLELVALILLGSAAACSPADHQATTAAGGSAPTQGPAASSESLFERRRQRMVAEQLRGRDITDRRLLEVMGRVPRHRFVPPDWQAWAYEDHPLPIGQGQTISQPYIVALMTQLAAPKPGAKALEIGTGSGYQAAVLAGLVRQVYSIEIHCDLAAEARRRLAALGYRNVEIRCGDGFRGWPEQAPFDIILVTAAPPEVPPPLLEQLAVGGRLVLPVGRGGIQQLLVIEKRPDGSLDRRMVAPVRFVPMTGEAQKPPGRP